MTNPALGNPTAFALQTARSALQDARDYISEEHQCEHCATIRRAGSADARPRLVPLSLAQANALVKELHRHHKPVLRHRFSIGLSENGQLVGAAIVGRPVARALQDGTTAEVLRLVTDGTQNACSKLYAACWRAWRAMGGTRLITYVLASERGTSVKAAGWKELYTTKDRPKGWDTPSRPRVSGPQEPKTLWEMAL